MFGIKVLTQQAVLGRNLHQRNLPVDHHNTTTHLSCPCCSTGGRYLNDLWAFDLDTSSWKLVSLKAVAPTPDSAEADSPQQELLSSPTAQSDPSESKVAAAAAAVSARVGAAAATVGAAMADLLKVQRGPGGAAGLGPLAGHSVTAWGGRLVVVGGHSKVGV